MDKLAEYKPVVFTAAKGMTAMYFVACTTIGIVSEAVSLSEDAKQSKIPSCLIQKSTCPFDARKIAYTGYAGARITLGAVSGLLAGAIGFVAVPVTVIHHQFMKE